MNRKLIIIAIGFLSVCFVAAPDVVFAQAKKPNILVIWGDDIGWYNPSIYNRGDMGYSTPNIDRIGKGRRDVYLLVRPTELHRGTRSVHYWAVTDPHWSNESRITGRRHRPEREGSDDRRTA